MLKNLYVTLLLCLMGIILVACSNDEKYLTRVDVQPVVNVDAIEEEEMIVDLITLDSIQSLLEEVNWEPKSNPEVAGSEDLVATMFYSEEERSPDELYLYRIWFNSDDTLSIISNNEDEGYGTLDEEYADKLKNLLESYF